MEDSRYLEMLSDLTACAAEVLEQSGIQKPDAERLARGIAERLGFLFAGQQVYFAKGCLTAERDMQIYREFNGSNHGQLARKYNLTERHIYTIIARVRVEQIRNRQGILFPEMTNPQSA